MIFLRCLVLLLWINGSTYAQHPVDTVLAHQYYHTADSLTEQGQYEQANNLFQQAQHIYQSIGNWEKYIACLNSIAYNLWPVAAYDSATVVAQQALQLSKKHLGADHPEAAHAYDVLGIVQEYRGELQRAVSFYKQALEIRQKHFSENHPRMADSYENLGLAACQMGDYDQALTYHQRTLSIRLQTEPSNLLSLTHSYNNLGLVYSKKGLYQEALTYYQKGLAIRRKLFGEIHPRVAVSYSHLGQIYRHQGAYNQAIACYRKSLSINSELFGETHREIAINHTGLGSVYVRKKAYNRALGHYHKALSIYRRSFGETHPGVAISCNNLGTVYVEKSSYDQALVYYQKALSINRDLFGEIHREVATNYTGLGVVYERKGIHKRALTYYQKALAVERELYGKTHPYVADRYNRLGKMCQQQGDYEQALDYYQKSMTANGISLSSATYLHHDSSLANYLDGNTFLRTLNRKAQTLAKLDDDSLSFLTYQLADRLLDELRQSYQRHSDKSAFNHTVTTLYEGALYIALKRYAATNEEIYLQQAFYFSERSKANLLTTQLTVVEAQQFGQVSDSLLALESSLRTDRAFYRSQLASADSSAYQTKLFATNQRYDSLIKTLETQYPDYYQLKYTTHTATVPDIQAQLAKSEAVISYFIGDSTYYAFVVTSNQFRVVPLMVDTTLSEQITSLRQALRQDGTSTTVYQQTAYNLYQKLLTPVVADTAFASVKKLTIIPDGMLGYLPFELLLTQPATVAREYADLPYLLRDYIVRYGYSATWLFHPFSRSRTSASDQYIAFAPQYLSTMSDSVQQLAFGRFRNQIAPLRWNQQEVKNISEYLSGASYTQQGAVERRFKEEANRYSVIHLAMHALVDDQNPMYSRLIFSADTADTREDGSLYAYELYDMEIPAELAVLSACETGYGKLERGEGIMSLAQAFAYAGCPSIVMSHWLVDDKASAQLMDYFYRYLSEGFPKDEALWQAKLAYLETASVQKAHPYFWSNFVLVGNTDPIVSSTASPKQIFYVVGALLLLLGLVGTTYQLNYRLGTNKM